MKFARYVAVQIFAYGLDMGTFLLLFSLFDINAIASNVAGKIIAGGFAFFAHRIFTFEVHPDDNATAQRAGMYFLLLAINIPLSSGIFSVMLFAVPSHVIAKFISDVITVFLGYWLSKKFIFADRRQATNSASKKRSPI